MLNSDFINLNNDFANLECKYETDMNNQPEQNYGEQNDPEAVSCYKSESEMKYDEIYYDDEYINEFTNVEKLVEVISCIEPTNSVSIDNSMLDGILIRTISETPLLVNS
ncbi:TPA: hypothetical protein ACS72K_001085 [Providencia alcalifaciens]